jgi:mRNA-degrading endonuclease toxin of MazEF toxin-antitoxin module
MPPPWDGTICFTVVRVNGEQRKAMADQLSTISKLGLRQRIGNLARADIAAVERAICLQLGL